MRDEQATVEQRRCQNQSSDEWNVGLCCTTSRVVADTIAVQALSRRAIISLATISASASSCGVACGTGCSHGLILTSRACAGAAFARNRCENKTGMVNGL